MKQKIFKVLGYLMQVVLTALASAGIALLQGYLSSHGVHVGPELNPENTATIGTAVAGGRIAIGNIKNIKII